MFSLHFYKAFHFLHDCYYMYSMVWRSIQYASMPFPAQPQVVQGSVPAVGGALALFLKCM